MLATQCLVNAAVLTVNVWDPRQFSVSLRDRTEGANIVTFHSLTDQCHRRESVDSSQAVFLYVIGGRPVWVQTADGVVTCRTYDTQGRPWCTMMQPAGVTLQMTGEHLTQSAQQIQTSEGYTRTNEGGEMQWQQAQDEVSVIDCQLKMLDVRQQALVTALNVAHVKLKNLGNTLRLPDQSFYAIRFYSWLCGQFSALRQIMRA